MRNLFHILLGSNLGDRSIDVGMGTGSHGQALNKDAAGGSVVGKTIAGRYLIEAVVDEGGEAVVYQARHEALGKRVALKMLHAGPARSKETAALFLERAKIAASLQGPQVNRLADFGESPDGSFVVMDWVEGESLAAWMTRVPSPGLEEVLSIIEQIAGALAVAHAKGVVHGAISARRFVRVRQGEEDRIRVLGFGARADAEGASVRADVRALGELLLELASSAKFDGVMTFAVRRQREPALDVDLGQKVRKLPAALQAIVVKALSLEATKTYRRVEDFASDLERFRTGEIPDALLEMIASGSWALIPEDKSAAATDRAPVAPVAPKPKTGANRPATRSTKARVTKRAKQGLVQSRQTAIVVALTIFGLAAGWITTGWLTSDDESNDAAAQTVTSTTGISLDLRAYGPDE
jgi:hypothetical protein